MIPQDIPKIEFIHVFMTGYQPARNVSYNQPKPIEVVLKRLRFRAAQVFLSHRSTLGPARHPGRQQAPLDFRTWGAADGDGDPDPDPGDDLGEGGRQQGYSGSGIFHLPASFHGNPHSHYNPLLQHGHMATATAAAAATALPVALQSGCYHRPMSAESGNQHIYMEVDSK